MKVFFTLFVCLIITAIQAQTLSPETKSNAYQHLLEVNEYWSDHHIENDKEISFNSENERIRYHLEQVISDLRKSTPSYLTSEKVQRREGLLNSLTLYAQNEVFPINTGHVARTPYFIDQFSTHCAVGHLMQVSGNEALAQRIQKEHNYDYIRNITTQGVHEWATYNGFELEELAWIQPGYPINTLIKPIGNGTNGKIKRMKSIGQSIVFSGDFTEVDGQPCNGPGVIVNGTATCFDPAFSGIVNDIDGNIEGHVILTGSFADSGTNYPLVIHDGGKWNYFAVPDRDGAIGSALYVKQHFGIEARVVLTHSSLPGKQEIWSLHQTKWERIATVAGSVNAIEYGPEGYVYGGYFQNITTHNGLSDSSFSTQNAVFENSTNHSWKAVLSDIPDTVRTIHAANGSIYIGGDCENLGALNTVCLSEYKNGINQSILLSGDFDFNNSRRSIRQIASISDSSLLLAGDFTATGFLIYGNHLAEYNLSQSYLIPKADVDAPVLDIAEQQGKWYLGGRFTKNNRQVQPLNYLGFLDLLNNVSTYSKKYVFRPFPNPANTDLNIPIPGSGLFNTLDVFDANGKLALHQVFDKSTNQISINLENLNTGSYFLRLTGPRGESVSTSIDVIR